MKLLLIGRGRQVQAPRLAGGQITSKEVLRSVVFVCWLVRSFVLIPRNNN